MRLSSGQMRRVVHAVAFGADPAPPPRAKKARAPEAPREAAAVAREHAGWWDDPNVLGLCFSPKVRRGRVEDLSLQVWVRRKRPASRVPQRRRVPDSVRLEGLGLRGRVPTDVREVGAPCLEALISSARPVRPGYSASHRWGGSGTLGCVVRSLETDELLGLSCAHVIGRYGRGLPGDRVLVPSLEEARAHGTLSSARFGTLVKVAPLAPGFDQAPFNVDAATVRPDTPAALGRSIALLDVQPTGLRDDVPVGLPVRKVGSATELTFGAVQAVSLVLGLPYPGESGGERTLWFMDLLGITRFTSAGDSGALVLDEQGAAVGMHQAGFESLSVCTPIRRVLDSVGCTLALE